LYAGLPLHGEGLATNINFQNLDNVSVKSQQIGGTEAIQPMPQFRPTNESVRNQS